MADTYNVKIGDEIKTYEDGTSLEMIAHEYQSQYEHDIILAFRDKKLSELSKKITSDCEISFVTTADVPGIQAYRRSATLLMLKAFYEVAGSKNVENLRVDYSVSRGYYCMVKGKIDLNETFITAVEAKMKALVMENAPIYKRTVSVDSAKELFRRHKMFDKEKLFRFRRSSRVNIYNLKGFEDYFYGYMVPSTGYLKYFKLYLYDEGFVLQLPTKEAPETVPPFEPQTKLFNVLKESSDWCERLDINTVGDLNEKISQGKINELILVQEALQEKKIAEIASRIVEEGNKKFIMIAGPSSSGKTSFSHRLSIQLKANGLKPHPIAVDNYFVDRKYTPRDEKGEYNFEVLEALDIELFNKHMNELAQGKEISLPTYNFKTGVREYRGNTLRLGEEDILVIEGIHCLNDRLSYSLDKSSKFKIYISALTQLNVDEHNRIPTTDGRLIRRMVRDARTRGIGARETIARWQSVRHGEESYIFPYQEEADVMFNSALIYELAVLKVYAEPLLFGIDNNCPEYVEAKRLLKFLDYFLGIGSENIPNNSLVREFVGGSCFNV